MTIKKKMLQAAAGFGGDDDYWIALLGGSGTDVGLGVTVDSAYNIIVCGYTESDGAGSNDFLIAKYNSSGTLQWDKTLGGSNNDYGFGVTVDSADNIIVCGQTASAGGGLGACLIAKYNSSGTLQWDKTLGGSGTDLANGVAVDSADNIIVCGRTASDGAGGIDLLIAKYNSSGTLQWDKTLGGSSLDVGNGVTVDSADNIIVCGQTASDGDGANELLIAKYNSSGTLQWDKILGGTESDVATSVTVDSADNIIVCGQTASDGAGGSDLLIAKYNSSGTLQWDKTLGGSGNDYGQGVAVDSANNIIVCGRTESDGAGGFDFLIAKYNSSGTLQWDKTLGGSGNDVGYSVTVDSSYNIIVCGYTASDGAGGFGLLLAKLPPDGSGDGTYGGLVYQDAVLTSADAVLTDAAAVLTDAAAVLTSAAAVLTSADAVLTSELFPI
jgi:uncharacterized delta-60 repeat protein